ncbi:unnamed protein product [Durusdinium trenchii]|uniref:Uncharacterized protein n=1 Tax=Durusdinium trenchii TaxID=1381693 RepID=A0ABP0HZQ6_9DINO
MHACSTNPMEDPPPEPAEASLAFAEAEDRGGRADTPPVPPKVHRRGAEDGGDFRESRGCLGTRVAKTANTQELLWDLGQTYIFQPSCAQSRCAMSITTINSSSSACYHCVTPMISIIRLVFLCAQ